MYNAHDNAAAFLYTAMPVSNREAGAVPSGTEAGGLLPVMAFVPAQRLEKMYEPEVGFGVGTLFPELYKPWRVGYE